MGEPKCIYCGTSKDLSDSDIIPDTHRKMQIGGTYARGSNAENNRSCN